MTDLAKLKAWVHWRNKEKNLNDDERAFAKAIGGLIERLERYEEALKKISNGFGEEGLQYYAEENDETDEEYVMSFDKHDLAKMFLERYDEAHRALADVGEE